VWWWAAAVLSGAFALSPASAQTPDPLPGLPRPPDAPTSLFAPPLPAPPGSASADLPGPYFEQDPILDPPSLPPPGWFADLELGVLKPHVINHVTNLVQIPGNTVPDIVSLPSAPLDWTVSPRFEAGYRLPSGFGEFVVGYQFLASRGSGTVLGMDAPAALRSRLDINEADLDYASREWSLWPCWDMKWRFGVRVTSIYFDSQAVEPVAAALAGSGTFAQATSNRFVGVGPHLGLELGRRWDEYHLALFGRVDGWVSIGNTRQAFVEQSTNLDANGVPLTGRTVTLEAQAVPQLQAQLGVRWQPPLGHYTHIFAGYQYEYWWNAGRNSDTAFPTSRGSVNDQGLVLTAEFAY
jgi:hypothetical protein